MQRNTIGKRRVMVTEFEENAMYQIRKSIGHVQSRDIRNGVYECISP